MKRWLVLILCALLVLTPTLALAGGGAGKGDPAGCAGDSSAECVIPFVLIMGLLIGGIYYHAQHGKKAVAATGRATTCRYLPDLRASPAPAPLRLSTDSCPASFLPIEAEGLVLARW